MKVRKYYVFDAGCDHCMDAAKSLAEMSDSIKSFPKIHIIFSDSEEEMILILLLG